MYQKAFLTLLITVVAVFALADNRTLSESNNSSSISKTVPAPSLATREYPEHVPYMFLLEHVNRIRKQGDKLNRQGKDGSGFQRRLKNALDLNDQEFQSIDEIASHCESEVEQLDKKAAEIIAAFRLQYPPGKVPEGVIIPPPPAELLGLQEMRNSAILRARDRIRDVLGQDKFARFDEQVKRYLAPGIKRISSQ
jgi:hypothetical protein